MTCAHQLLHFESGNPGDMILVPKLRRLGSFWDWETADCRQSAEMSMLRVCRRCRKVGQKALGNRCVSELVRKGPRRTDVVVSSLHGETLGLQMERQLPTGARATSNDGGLITGPTGPVGSLKLGEILRHFIK